jgi:hypothetical protein
VATYTGISNIPFEQRYRPVKRPWRKPEPLGPVDRLVCAVVGSGLGLFVWTLGYLLWIWMLLRAAARQRPANGMNDPSELIPPFWWGAGVVIVFAAIGAFGGPERLIGAFQRTIRAEDACAQAIRHS